MRAVRLAVALLCAPAATAAWSDDFTVYNASLWTQATDIEHCSDGACFQAAPDHLRYSPAGLLATMSRSPCNETAGGCCVGKKCAQWASGKLASVGETLYGTYSARLQPAHRAGGGVPPANAFSCWTPTYRTTPHNEIAICFSGSDASSVHFSYWYDSTAHTTLLYPGFQFSAAMHDYRVVWAPTSLHFYIDDVLAHSVTGTTATIPNEAGYMAIILRPKTDAYIADSYFGVESISYDETY